MADTEKRPWWADDIAQAWKWFQVQLGAVIAAAPALYSQVDQVRELLTPEQMLRFMSLLGWLVIFNAVRNKNNGSSGTTQPPAP